jgi:hypothetical protein
MCATRSRQKIKRNERDSGFGCGLILAFERRDFFNTIDLKIGELNDRIRRRMFHLLFGYILIFGIFPV